MLAQLFETKGVTSGQVIDYAKRVAERTRQLDGCEGVYVMTDGSDVGLALAIWRDRASMESAGAGQQGDIEKTSDDVGVTISGTRVYDIVISA